MLLLVPFFIVVAATTATVFLVCSSISVFIFSPSSCAALAFHSSSIVVPAPVSFFFLVCTVAPTLIRTDVVEPEQLNNAPLRNVVVAGNLL